MTIYKRSPSKQNGFSLLEILIAFSILSLSLGILLKIFSAGAATAAIAEDYTSAVQIAESLMAKTGVETLLKPGESTGIENEKYRWLVAVQPFLPSITKTDPKKMSVILYKVKVIVSWGDENEDDRQIELTSLKLVTDEL
jgi:general secretion pathway protein I